MGIDDITNKAKEMLGDQDANIDKAAEAAKKVAPDSVDAHIDNAATKAKEIL